MLQATADPAIVRQLEALEEQLASTWKNRDRAGWGGLLPVGGIDKLGVSLPAHNECPAIAVKLSNQHTIRISRQLQRKAVK